MLPRYHSSELISLASKEYKKEKDSKLEDIGGKVSHCKLRPRRDKSIKDESMIGGGLAIDSKQPPSVGRKSYLSLAKKKAKRKIKEGKQKTIKGSFRAGSASNRMKP